MQATDSRLQSEEQSKNSILNHKKNETWLPLEIKISALYASFPFPKCVFLKDALLVKRNMMSNSYFLLILLPVGICSLVWSHMFITRWVSYVPTGTCLVYSPACDEMERMENALQLQLGWHCLCKRLIQKWSWQSEGRMCLHQACTC